MHGCYVSARNRDAACTSRSDARTCSRVAYAPAAAARARGWRLPQLASRERTFQRPPEKRLNRVRRCLSSASDDANPNPASCGFGKRVPGFWGQRSAYGFSCLLFNFNRNKNTTARVACS